MRLTRAPFVSIALIRGRATGNGSELALACDMSFASRENALLSQFEVGVGLVPGGGPMARLPRVMGRARALEVLLSADDIHAADAELLGYVNRALPDAELDDFVDALATRIASFDRWAIANTKRLVNEAACRPTSRSERAGTPAWPPSSDRRRRNASRPCWNEGSRRLETRRTGSGSTWAGQSHLLKGNMTMDLLTIAKEIADRVEAESLERDVPVAVT